MYIVYIGAKQYSQISKFYYRNKNQHSMKLNDINHFID